MFTQIAKCNLKILLSNQKILFKTVTCSRAAATFFKCFQARKLEKILLLRGLAWGRGSIILFQSYSILSLVWILLHLFRLHFVSVDITASSLTTLVTLPRNCCPSYRKMSSCSIHPLQPFCFINFITSV